MNQQLTSLLSGYQDLIDRYGSDDPMVQDLKAEIERRQLLDHPVRLVERRRPGSSLGVWNRAAKGTSLQA